MTHENFLMYYATQPDFCPERYDIQTTIQKFIAYLNRVLDDQFRKYSLMTVMPTVLAYRLGLLVRNTIFYELFCLLAPEEISFDIFTLVCMRGCGLLAAYFSPCGTNKNHFRFF